MTTDHIQAAALVVSVASLVGGVWIIAGSGAALMTFGAMLLWAVIFARNKRNGN